MKVTILIYSLFLSLTIFANDNNSLTVKQDGFIVEVVDFEEGDKIKLFEVESGDHILSKSYSFIDLSQLAIGSYLLENNKGRSIVIDRLEEELIIDGTVLSEEKDIMVVGEDIVVEEDNVVQAINDDTQETDLEQEFVSEYVEEVNKKQLSVLRDGDIIEVIDFEEGDKLKLFEVKDTVHVLSKTTNVIDLSQLPAGVYFLKNNKGNSVVIEKFVGTETNITDI